LNGPVLLEVLKIVGASIGLAAGALVTYWRFRDKRMRDELGLLGNPTQCGEHEKAIDNLEKTMCKLESDNREDHRNIFGQLSSIAIESAKVATQVAGLSVELHRNK
jgi:hypothetical protein